MKTRSKVLIAAAVAAVLGAGALGGTVLADSQGQWRGWHMDGMHDGYGRWGMGMHDGYGRWGMHDGYGRRGMHDGYGRHGGWGMRERIRDFADRYDADKDGKITQAEIDANRAETFKKHDTNGDGKLSLEEFQNLWLAAKHRNMVRSFQNFDVDGTGAITLDAYNARMGHIVEMLDQNDDGALSRDDMKAWRQFHRSRWNTRDNKYQGRMPMMDGNDDDDNGAGDDGENQSQQ